MGKFYNKPVQYVDQLNVLQLKKLLDYLFDGYLPCAEWLVKITTFYADKKDRSREHAVYLWLAKNQIIGKKIVEFFENEGSFLDGLNTAVNFIEGRPRAKQTIKADEML